MLTGILAGLAAGALWSLVFVMPRMLYVGPGGHNSVDVTASRDAAFGVASVLAILFGVLLSANEPR